MNNNTWKNISEIKDEAIWELAKLVDDIICKSSISTEDFEKYNKRKHDIICQQMTNSYKEIFKD